MPTFLGGALSTMKDLESKGVNTKVFWFLMQQQQRPRADEVIEQQNALINHECKVHDREVKVEKIGYQV